MSEANETTVRMAGLVRRYWPSVDYRDVEAIFLQIVGGEYAGESRSQYNDFHQFRLRSMQARPRQ